MKWSRRKDMNVMLERAVAAGCDVSLSGGDHVRVLCPNGTTVTCSQSPSDRMAHKRLLRDLRVYGKVDLRESGRATGSAGAREGTS